MPQLEVLIQLWLNKMIKTIIFDWKRTLYDPDKRMLIDGALDLLQNLKKKNISMILVGKGGHEMTEEVNRLGVGKYFNKIVFAEGEKDPEVFKSLIKNEKECVFIGDRVRSELEIGKRLGATTIWIKQGKFSSELPETKDQEPDYIIDNLAKCLNVIFNNPKIT